MKAAKSVAVMPTRPAGDLTHSFRASLFSHERRFVLKATSLVWSDQRGEHTVPLSDVRRVQIYHAPASGGRTIRRTVIRLQDGRKLIVQSNHFVRLATFEDRVESYTAWVRALLGHLAAANPRAQVLIGPPLGLWITYLALLIASAGVLLAGAILWAIGWFPFSAAVTFALLAGFLPLCWRVVRGGRARAMGAATARDRLDE
jgi:hypothetical protein